MVLDAASVGDHRSPPLRTETIDAHHPHIDGDVQSAAKELARRERKTAGELVSDFIREALQAQARKFPTCCHMPHREACLKSAFFSDNESSSIVGGEQSARRDSAPPVRARPHRSLEGDPWQATPTPNSNS